MRERAKPIHYAEHRAVAGLRLVRTIPIACLSALVACGGEATTSPVSPADTTSVQQEIPITGAAVPGLVPFDHSVRDLMRKYAIPGGAVGLVRDGKLIYARGFGYADVENKTPVKPDALFRIASVSKPITGVAIMKLVEEGKLPRVAPPTRADFREEAVGP
jgi:N-acyl-D-amino-acid deacylase